MSVLNGAMLTGASEDGARKAAKNLAMIFGSIPGQVFWPYFAGASISLAGALAVKGEVLFAKGTDKIVSMGRLFFAVPMAVFGAQHFTEAKFIVQLVPSWIPGAWFWTYFVGTALIAAALSMVVKKQAGLAASLLALMLFLFVVLMHIPNVVAKPSDRVLWAVALRDLSFSGGALALAGMQINEMESQSEECAHHHRPDFHCRRYDLLRYRTTSPSRLRARRSAGKAYANVDSGPSAVGLCCGCGFPRRRAVHPCEPQGAPRGNVRRRDGAAVGIVCLFADVGRQIL